MDDFKGTPGPWAVAPGLVRNDEARDVVKYDSQPDDYQLIAEVREFYSPAERDANAHLIAAAPDLLAALLRMQRCGLPTRASLYDEEGIDGWRWVDPLDGSEVFAMGHWEDEPPLPPFAEEAIAKALGAQS